MKSEIENKGEIKCLNKIKRLIKKIKFKIFWKEKITIKEIFILRFKKL